jgi:hypothetical protein
MDEINTAANGCGLFFAAYLFSRLQCIMCFRTVLWGISYRTAFVWKRWQGTRTLPARVELEAVGSDFPSYLGLALLSFQLIQAYGCYVLATCGQGTASCVS